MSSYYFFGLKTEQNEAFAGCLVPDVGLDEFKERVEKDKLEITHTEMISETLFNFILAATSEKSELIAKVIGADKNNIKIETK